MLILMIQYFFLFNLYKRNYIVDLTKLSVKATKILLNQLNSFVGGGSIKKNIKSSKKVFLVAKKCF